MAEELLVFKNVNKVYENGEERIYALKNINLSIFRGEFVAILGMSGQVNPLL